MFVKQSTLKKVPSIFLAVALLYGCGEDDIDSAIETEPRTLSSTYSPYSGTALPMRVYWGDTHLHTKLSPDANVNRNVSLSPADAFRFARGEKVTAHNGMIAQLKRPLDFLVVTDHAEYLGVVTALRDEEEEVIGTEWGQAMYPLLTGTPLEQQQFFAMMLTEIARNDPQFESEAFTQNIWKYVSETADAYNSPGIFTAFTGYEWTSMPGGNNLHRVVIFKDDASFTQKVVPFSAFDSENPEDLWAYLENYEANTGGNVLAIPHNGNVSNGLMFAELDFDGEPLTKNYAETRMKWEPIMEITQIKGDGETHPYLSPTDEFADYESWDMGNIIFSELKEESMLKHEYARSALKIGLQLGNSLGVNPFKFGFQGASDAHTSLSGMAEDNYWGKFTTYEPSRGRVEHPLVRAGDETGGLVQEEDILGDIMGAGAYTGVWAHDNTRAAIFEAMERKEVYATTGPRITLRMFGGWDFKQADVYSVRMAEIGYEKGVPMGGDLSAERGDAPTFMIVALKDLSGANLDRVQVVKGWTDASGKAFEKVYNVALSDGRAVNDTPEKVGNTVDLENATYSNSIGAVQLSVVWRDPDFDAAQDAFYYTRVLEIPTPRWTAYDAKFFGTELKENEAFPNIIQERAYSSPIWYSAVISDNP